MARLGDVVKNNKRRKLIDQYKVLRLKLKTIIASPSSSEEEVSEALVRIQKIPRNASPVRWRSRCLLTGRSRGNLKKFGISRIKFRELASRGMIPGVKKASW